MSVKERLRLIPQALGEGVTDFQAGTGAASTWASELDRRAKGAIALGGASLYSLYFVAAVHAAPGGCNSGAASKLVGLLDSAAKFMMAIGGAGALLMFAVGAAFIIFGGTGSRVSKGFGMLKNAVIGVAVLAAGLFIKEVVLSFVSGATAQNTPGCVNKNAGGLR